MNLYIDTEFNEYQGELISIALVSNDGREFYEVLEMTETPGAWVAEHVMPMLRRAPIPRRYVQKYLQNFLAGYDRIHVVADWPDDLRHFCDLLVTGPGERLDTPPLTFEVRRDLNSDTSDLPHNALEDARALRRAATGEIANYKLRLARLLYELHRDEVLSEQQCASRFDCDLVTWRRMRECYEIGDRAAGKPILE